ncbi:alpha-glucosidase [Desulfosporosinus sp. BICA1-9]|uniref:glycoside hydrolase family 13 protein n=1 Tax=Desulfosporosinus sp. BICA1-9 TaxID=1531958 RepID=UPI00054BC0B1|nr:alpha-glucosidase [Desulfosporosinus sp. BICA1-9]KJS46669.1 MAG: oligo-1,6-glucosidase [Peptococcaceae bacterium BRH_c23]KJS79590.1 MAG: oligo-1,6-glucosidase [Desulfosporosinus sp. BICA1-9]HBW36241.1 alpha-glucosidase [Desulfosporosinus sp.]
MPKKKWWKESVVYQIYPRSFKDSNGDGTGDLKGIISKLDYLQYLGVNVLWISPIYRSPNVDNGYDISDYRGVMDEMGTMADWEDLRDGLHSRGMKLVMDLVVNHTSDQHRWFLESRSSKDNPYRDYYIWRAGKDGKEPNNWSSEFSGSAWEYDALTEEYYLHVFSKNQPDLNWENKRVRYEIYDMMKWWLDQGVDGFRMDVINMIAKDPMLPDAPAKDSSPYQWGGQFFINGPRLQYYLREMYTKVLSKYDIMTVGETRWVDANLACVFVDECRHELNMLFQFELLELDYGPSGKWEKKPWELADFKRIISDWQTKLADFGWNSLFLSNHDHPRMVSRFGNDSTYRVESAKMLATLLHTLQGTPYIYQGEEIGMTNVCFDCIEHYRDIETLNMYAEGLKNGKDLQELTEVIYEKGRDNARTPMQWDNSPNAGFTEGTPWIPVNPNYPDINVEQARQDPTSILHYYRKLIELRRQYPLFVYGDYHLLLPMHTKIYSYLRHWEEETLLVILNFFHKSTAFTLPKKVIFQTGRLIIANYSDTKAKIVADDLKEFSLRPYEARVYLLN